MVFEKDLNFNSGEALGWKRKWMRDRMHLEVLNYGI
jgi:hypothetical protein